VSDAGDVEVAGVLTGVVVPANLERHYLAIGVEDRDEQTCRAAEARGFWRCWWSCGC